MGRLILLFTLAPALELALLIEVGSRIGTAATIGAIVATGVLGAVLARKQGLHLLRRIQSELSGGRLPASSLVDGVIVLVAGALLVTPGILTDVLGLLCLVPGFRSLIKAGLRRRFERALLERRIVVDRFDGTVDAEFSRDETPREEP